MSTRSDGQGGDTPHDEAAEATARKQRQIQSAQDRKDRENKGGSDQGEDKAVQAGARPQPEQLPAQHLRKPGSEADLDLAPQFMAPDYRGSGKLAGFAAIVTGGDSGIGRAVAVLFAREGADVTIAYLEEHADAAETRRCVEAEGRRCVLVAGRRQGPEVRRQGRREHARGVRPPRRAGQQRRLPGACRARSRT